MASATPKRKPAPTGDAVPFGPSPLEASARTRVILWLQQAVTEGRAVWKIRASGLSEVHFNSGEAFLLEVDGISRIQKSTWTGLHS